MQVTSKRRNEWFIPSRVALVTHNVKRNGSMVSCDQGMACVLFWIFKLEKFEFKREKGNNEFGRARAKSHLSLRWHEKWQQDSKVLQRKLRKLGLLENGTQNS